MSLNNHTFDIKEQWLVVMTPLTLDVKNHTENVKKVLDSFEEDDIVFEYKESKQITHGENKFIMMLFQAKGEKAHDLEEEIMLFLNENEAENTAIAYGLRKE